MCPSLASRHSSSKKGRPELCPTYRRDVKHLDHDKLKHIEHDVQKHNEREDMEQWFRVIAAIAAVVLGIGASVFLWSELIALLTFQWLPPSQNLSALTSTISNLPAHLGDPKQAWPKALQSHLPGHLLFVPLLLILAGAEGFYLYKAYRWWKGRKSKDDRGDTGWADQRDLRVITDIKKNPKLSKGVVLGLSQDKKLLRLEPDNHALVVAGTRSGKTAGLCVPALLTYEGAVIATSVKDDLVKETIKQRQKMGDVYIFDPVGAMGLPEDQVAGWTPLEISREWREAQRTAAALIEVAMGGSNSGGGNMEFFKRQSQIVLPVLLYAAAVMDEDMRRVLRWLHRINDTNTHSEVDSILRWKKNSKALDAWVGFVTKDQKIRGDIAATIQTALVSYEDEKVQQNAMRCDITPEKLFNGGQNTLYVVAPLAEQQRLEPIFVALMQSLLIWVTEHADLETPLLTVLDEAANIAALPMLPTFLSAIGSKHVQIITSWQDFSQIKARYPDKMNTVINNSRGKLILPGVADPETLQYFSQVTGETIEETISVSKPQQGQKSYSFGEGRRALLSPATIREQQLGEAILVYGHLPPAKIKLRMYFKDPVLKAMAAGQAMPKMVAAGPFAQLTRALPFVTVPLKALNRVPLAKMLPSGSRQKELPAAPAVAALPPAPALAFEDVEEQPVAVPQTPASGQAPETRVRRRR